MEPLRRHHESLLNYAVRDAIRIAIATPFATPSTPA
jgi:hypothetical protein